MRRYLQRRGPQLDFFHGQLREAVVRRYLPPDPVSHHAAIARYLENHPKVRRVNYPGLPSHPQHDLARKQQRGFGAMLSFDVGTLESARRLLNHVKLCSLAESLGGVETLISHPAMMTHASMPSEVRQQIGITDGLVRLSVGIEDEEDLIADLDAALEKV